MHIPILVSWSGGKDAAWTLHALQADPHYDVIGLLTTVTDEYDRVAMHGIRRDVLHAQAAAVGLPLIEARLPRGADNTTYEASFANALNAARERWPELQHIAFGDLFLEDIRAYRDAMLQTVGMTAVYPLWGRDTGALAREFIAQGYKAILCCVDPTQIAANLCGRDYDETLLADLPETADACGEKGEFHTFVHDAPIFSRPVACVRGDAVLRDHFWFCDILPDAGLTAASATPAASDARAARAAG
mgnify:CR=1 FL=1